MNMSAAGNNTWASAFFDYSVTTEDDAAVVVASNINVTLPRFADHSYHDFSTFIANGGKVEKHKKSDRNFPARLHAILADERYAHIITWMPHGRAWKVLDKDLLVETVIPKYFGQSKFASFTRQLSGWGFKRLHQTGPDFGCYYNECFLRGHPQLTVLMRRVSPGQGKATPHANSEPDFYLIAKQFPLHPKGTGKKPVPSSKFEGKKKGTDGVGPAVEKPTAAEEVTSFDPLPVSSYNNLNLFAASAASSRPDSSVSQFPQYFGKAQAETCRSMFLNDQYLAGATGNLYQNAQTRSPQTASTNPPFAASICTEDGLCQTDDTSSCHGGKSRHHQHSVGNVAPYAYPPVQQCLYQNPTTLNRNSLGYGGMNIYNQHQQNQNNYVQQDQDHGQPAYCSSSSTGSPPNRFPQNNAWDDKDLTNDSLKEMSMSIPEEGFDFNISSIEASFCISPVETTPTPTFLG